MVAAKVKKLWWVTWLVLVILWSGLCDRGLAGLVLPLRCLIIKLK